MELKTFFAQDTFGNVVPSPSVTAYIAGTTTLATGLKNATGGSLSNPFTGTSEGLVQFAAPPGDYELRISASGKTYTLLVRFVDSVGFMSLAQNLDAIIVGAITRDANGAATSASVVWPDGATGTYTATTVSTAFPGAVDAYTVTHVLGGVTTTYTQPAVTRDSTGAVTNKPAMTVA